MKFLLISAALVAVAFASPVLVQPEVAGPAPVITEPLPIVVGPAIIEEPQGIVVGPAIIDEGHQDLVVGPAIIDEPQDIVVGPAIIDEAPQDVVVGPAIIDEAPQVQSKPLVQIIININNQNHVVDIPTEVIPDPVIVVEDAEDIIPDPVIVVEEAENVETDPAPVILPAPVLPEVVQPEPVITLPDSLN